MKVRSIIIASYFSIIFEEYLPNQSTLSQPVWNFCPNVELNYVEKLLPRYTSLFEDLVWIIANRKCGFLIFYRKLILLPLNISFIFSSFLQNIFINFKTMFQSTNFGEIVLDFPLLVVSYRQWCVTLPIR